MKLFIQKHFNIILIVFMILLYIKIQQQINLMKTQQNEFNKFVQHINKTILIEGLKSEKRMIQSVDRKIIDVNRQKEIDNEIKILNEEKK